MSLNLKTLFQSLDCDPLIRRHPPPEADSESASSLAFPSSLAAGSGRKSKGRAAALTVVAVVEDNELLPAQLRHQLEHDVVEADGRAGRQGVALAVGAGVELAGGARGALAVALHVEVRDVHGVGQGLQGAGRGAARGGHQRQDALGHQLTGCTGEMGVGKNHTVSANVVENGTRRATQRSASPSYQDKVAIKGVERDTITAAKNVLTSKT